MALTLPPASDPGTSPPALQVSLAVLAAIVVVAAAVSVGGTAAYFDLRPNSTTGTVVVDDLGRKVVVPPDPDRLVVLAPSVMDIVYRLGLRGSVVGVGCTASEAGGIFNEYSPNQTALWSLTNASCVPDFPALDTGDVALLAPQVVLATTITSALAVDQLTSTYGIPVLVLAPSTLEGIVGDVRLLAQVFPEAQPAATVLEGELGDALANASAWDANFSENDVSFPTVLLSYYFDPGGYYTYGPGSFGDSLIALAGGDNLGASVPLLYAEMNATVALVDQPRIILYGTSNDTYLVLGETPSLWPSAPYWSQLTGQKIAVDVTLLTEPDPTMILFLPALMHWLHPTLVPAP
jgi:ABC-type Fe3+-hydroxamate transport system substrate-binding protein